MENCCNEYFFNFLIIRNEKKLQKYVPVDNFCKALPSDQKLAKGNRTGTH